MRFESGVGRAFHHRAQEHGLEVAAVISEVAVGLAEGGDDLRHLEPEHALASVSVAPWLCGSRSWPSVVWAQIWMR